VQADNIPDVGVPNNGVTSVGLVDNTKLPEPVDDETPVPPFATLSIPDEIPKSISDKFLAIDYFL
jgi:hypothetical protein